MWFTNWQNLAGMFTLSDTDLPSAQIFLSQLCLVTCDSCRYAVQHVGLILCLHFSGTVSDTCKLIMPGGKVIEEEAWRTGEWVRRKGVTLGRMGGVRETARGQNKKETRAARQHKCEREKKVWHKEERGWRRGGTAHFSLDLSDSFLPNTFCSPHSNIKFCNYSRQLQAINQTFILRYCTVSTILIT